MFIVDVQMTFDNEADAFAATEEMFRMPFNGISRVIDAYPKVN